MRISREQVEKITRTVLDNLKGKDLVVLKATEAEILEKMNSVVLENLRAEDALDREVEEILKAHAGEAGEQRVDYRKMFNMVKNKLARERGVIL